MLGLAAIGAHIMLENALVQSWTPVSAMFDAPPWTCASSIIARNRVRQAGPAGSVENDPEPPSTNWASIREARIAKNRRDGCLGCESPARLHLGGSTDICGCGEAYAQAALEGLPVG
jgi:hypothetical protein